MIGYQHNELEVYDSLPQELRIIVSESNLDVFLIREYIDSGLTIEQIKELINV